MSTADYVFFSSKTQAFECHHCGGQYAPTLPMPIDQFVSMGKGFVLMHKHCPKPVEPSRQLPLPHTNHTDVIQGIDGSSDEPDPETDPPLPRLEPNQGVEVYKMFDMNYPKATTHHHLRDALHEALTEAEYALLGPKTVESWHPKSGAFEAVAHWARVENAHKSHANRKPTTGIVLPERCGMPYALALALAGTPVPKKSRKKREGKP